jgi:hypothetical protein
MSQPSRRLVLDVPRLAPEPVSCPLVRPQPRLVPSPVSHREQPVALADTPQQVGEVDQVLGDQVYYRALALHPALAGQQAG